MKAALGLLHLILFLFICILMLIIRLIKLLLHQINIIYSKLIYNLMTKTHINHHQQQHRYHEQQPHHRNGHHHPRDAFELPLKDCPDSKKSEKVAYMRSLHWKQCPKVLRKDWNWYVRSYKSGELEDYEGYYVILGQGCVTDKMKFQNAMEAAEYMEEQNCSGIIVHVGPEERVASLRAITSKIEWQEGGTWMRPTVTEMIINKFIRH